MKYVMCLVASLVATLSYGQEEHQYQYAEIGRNKIAFSCEGDGDNTVVLIAGMGLDAHRSFSNIYHNYQSDDYRICMYDRASVGQSTFVEPRARTLAELVEELRKLVQRNGWRNTVLVAHSFGGFIVRGYVNTYPQDVKAVLFADAVGQSWYSSMKKNMTPEGWAIMESVIEWEKRRNSREDYVDALVSLKDSAFPKDLPITVLSRGLPYTTIRQARLSYFDVDVYNTTWDHAQYDLVNLSEDSSHVIMRYSDHFVDDHDPWLVLDELYKLQERVK